LKVEKVSNYSPEYPSLEKLKKKDTKGLKSALLAAAVL